MVDSLEKEEIKRGKNEVIPCIYERCFAYVYDQNKNNLAHLLASILNVDVLKIKNNIDLISFLWQNIVLEVPSKVRGKKDEEITLEGDGWRLMTEDEYNKGNNLGLSELKTLLDKRKE